MCVNRTGARAFKECAPQSSKGSSGIAERAVQSVEQYFRTLKSSLDERMGVKIEVLHPVLTWLCEFVGYMMDLMEIASDGNTPNERVKGKRSEVMGLEFCEKVHWKYHPGERMAKFHARWRLWLILGVKSRSGELIVVHGESKEVKCVRTVKRVLEEQWWDPNTIGDKMITNWRFFYFDPQFWPKTTRILQKTPEFQKMTIMIFLSELILAFFGVKQRTGGYERGEERKEKREERRRCGLRCNVLSRAVLSCAVDIYIYIYIVRRL